ncbi:unnamed protein product [Ectocarpus sp. 8 AP-2014]
MHIQFTRSSSLRSHHARPLYDQLSTRKNIRYNNVWSTGPTRHPRPRLYRSVTCRTCCADLSLRYPRSYPQAILPRLSNRARLKVTWQKQRNKHIVLRTEDYSAKISFVNLTPILLENFNIRRTSTNENYNSR